MIRLTRRDVGNFIINVDHIISITGDKQARVFTVEDSYDVTESPEEVTRKILEYKLAMVRYRVSSASAFMHRIESGKNPYTAPLDEVLILDRLAGLEVSHEST